LTHLDTSFIVDLLREARAGRSEDGPAHRLLATLADEPLAVSVHVACELHAGVALSDDPASEGPKVDALLGALEVVRPDDGFAQRYGVTLAELRRRGQTVPTMDLLIATAALGHDADLVTRNARDFDRIPGLRVAGY
jgi:tRNA(fMet)-specific endonuclease VapC